jgi:hypothetical protein
MSKKTKILIKQYLSILSRSNEFPCAKGPTEYAYEQTKLVNRLKWDGADSPKSYLQLVDKEFWKTLSIFEATSAAATYSPHRPLEDEPYYVKTRTLDELDILIPDQDGYISATHFVHIGPKGSGKTTVQNHWLSTRHELLESRKIFYVRCDAPKIYDLFRQFPFDSNWDIALLPSLEEYLDFQMLYILAKHSNGGLLEKLFNELKDDKATFNYKEARSFDSPARLPKEISWFLESHIRDSISNYETDPNDKDKSYIRDVLFRDKKTRRREFFQWKECAAALKTWMWKKKYILLRIVDGIDNLHLNSNAGIRAYEAFLPEVSNFILRSAPTNEIRFVVMRKGTWTDILNKDPVTQGSGSIIQPEIITHIKPGNQEIAKARINWIKLHKPNKDVESVIDAAAFALPHIEPFDENIRNLIASMTTLAIQVRFRSHQLGFDIDYRKQANTQMKRNLFLNGRFFLSTERDWPVMNREKGLPFLNPFWFKDEFSLSDNHKDPLFLRIRLLELLSASDLLKSSLIKILVNSFGYDENHVHIAINDARGFGWIDLKEGIASLVYKLSPTGKYLLTTLLTDVSVLYMLALDTRIPKVFFEKDFIRVHTNHLYEKSGYFAAAVITVLSFLYYLKFRSDSELKPITDNLKPHHYQRVFLSEKAIRQIGKELFLLVCASEPDDKQLISIRFEQLIAFAQNATAKQQAAM